MTFVLFFALYSFHVKLWNCSGVARTAHSAWPSHSHNLESSGRGLESGSLVIGFQKAWHWGMLCALGCQSPRNRDWQTPAPPCHPVVSVSVGDTVTIHHPTMAASTIPPGYHPPRTTLHPNWTFVQCPKTVIHIDYWGLILSTKTAT